MKPKKEIKGAEYFGVKITVSKELDKYADIDLFPEKTALANKVLSNIKFTTLKIK